MERAIGYEYKTDGGYWDGNEGSEAEELEQWTNDRNERFCREGEDCDCYDQTSWGGPIHEGSREQHFYEDDGQEHEAGLLYYCRLKLVVDKTNLRALEIFYIKAFDAQMKIQQSTLGQKEMNLLKGQIQACITHVRMGKRSARNKKRRAPTESETDDRSGPTKKLQIVDQKAQEQLRDI